MILFLCCACVCLFLCVCTCVCVLNISHTMCMLSFTVIMIPFAIQFFIPHDLTCQYLFVLP